MKYLSNISIKDRIFSLKKKSAINSTPVYNQWYYYSHTHFGEHPMYNHEANRGGVDEGSEMWLRRIFSIGADDLSSRTFHRNIEYDKIISRHPSPLMPPPFAHRPERSPFCGSVGNGRA